MTSLRKRSLKKIFLLLLWFWNVGIMSANAQVDSSLKKVSCDCAEAIHIDIFKRARYGFTQAPQGFGDVQEIKAGAKTIKSAFEKEHNTAWYLVEIKGDGGELVFDIIPKNASDDYDFLLFPYKDSLTCNNIIAEKIKPLRGNLSRNDTNNKGITGLTSTVSHEFNGKGVGAQYSKSIIVRNGDRFLLVLDNVYEAGKGHKIEFSFSKQITIEGQVINEDGKALQAEVTLYDDKGMELMKTQSTSEGTYKMMPTITEHVDYTLTITADSFFLGTETINTDKIKDERALVNIKTILPKLKKGGKYKLGNLNFWGDSHVLIPRSAPSMNYLYLLMKKNKNMKIQIEGHVNGQSNWSGAAQGESNWQGLSERRADTVFQYLKGKGIDEKRMSKIGYAAKYMLFPKAMNSYEGEANRRVEIKVISMD